MIIRSVFLLIPCVVIILMKVILFQDCFSFDSHDDANHAFPNLSLSMEYIKNLSIPTFNFYNNFGVPLLGDALTYPFSLQSITYYILPDYIAMTINRILIIFLTYFAAFKFYQIHNLSTSIPILSLITLFIPVAFWYPVHHYQMNLFFFLFIFFLIDKFFKIPNKRNCLILFLVSIFYVFSVSINLVLLALPFYLIWVILRYDDLKPKIIFLSGLFFSVLAITFFQNYEFFSNYFNSGRIDESVYYTILTSFRELFLGVIFTPAEWIGYNYGAQLQIISYISFPIIIFAINGFFIKSPNKKIILYCGLIATVIALFLYVQTKIWLNIPLIKNFDILRVFWFSLPFVYISIGVMYENYNKIEKKNIIFSIIFSLSLTILFFYFEEIRDVSWVYFFQFIFSLLFFIFLYSKYKFKYQLLPFILSISLILVITPVFYRIVGLDTNNCIATQYSTNKNNAFLVPNEFLPYLDEKSRVTTEIHTHKGQDTRLTKSRVFAGNARGIVVDKKFGKILEDNNLVTVDQVPYGYFFSRPWDTNKLSILGIRYLITQKRSESLIKQGWSLLLKTNNYYLYENPFKPSIAHIKLESGERKFLNKNHINIKNKSLFLNAKIEEDSNLIVSLNMRDEFKITDNGKQINSVNNELGLVEIPLKKGNHEIIIMYDNFSFGFIILSIVLSFLILMFSLKNFLKDKYEANTI